jgi:catechol-2,3-dioxygenase
MASTDEELVTPREIGHFGVRTIPENYDAMVKWYLDFFGGRARVSTPRATMITYDDEHHRMVIVADPSHQLIKNKRHAAGIYHIAFTLSSLSELAKSYEQKKARGILPHWPVNHGMTTSMYYFDPDGNEFELQVDNFKTTEEVDEFMVSPDFSVNPIGVDIVPDDWIKKLRSGVDEETLKKRPIIGKRRSRFENSLYFKPTDPESNISPEDAQVYTMYAGPPISRDVTATA